MRMSVSDALIQVSHMYHPNGVSLFLQSGMFIRDVKPRGILVLEVVVLGDMDISLGELILVFFSKIRPVSNS